MSVRSVGRDFSLFAGIFLLFFVHPAILPQIFNLPISPLLDPSPGISVLPITGLQTSESGGSATFQVVLDTSPLDNVRISLASSDTSEGTVQPDGLTFTVDNWNTPQTVTVTGVDDFLVDGNVSYTIITGLAVSSDPAYDGLDAPDVSVNNMDNDFYGVKIAPTSGLVTSESGASATFTVLLGAPPTDNVTIHLASSDPSEGKVSPDKLTFSKSNWNIAQTVKVTGVDDTVVDGPIAYQVITTLNSKDPNYRNINPPDVSLVNLDNDVYSSPTAVADAYRLNKNSTLTIPAPGVLANDTNPAGNPALSAQLSASVSHGSLTLNTDGSFSYKPALDYVGQDTFTYQAVSGGQSSNTATVTLTILEPNLAPTAMNDAYGINQDSTLIVNAASGVLRNDSDPNGDSLTALLVNSTTHGSLTLNPDGSFSYIPLAGFTGSDLFTYKASDQHLTSNLATVTITVTLTNHAPVAVNDTYLTNKALSIAAASGLLHNDSDPDGNLVSVNSYSQPSSGVLVVNPNGSFTYTPATGFDGSVTFTYRISDGKMLSEPATVTIRVDITPPAPVTWSAPVVNGAVYTINRGSVTLLVQPTTTTPDLALIIFYRWDPALQKRIELGRVASAPYQYLINVTSLSLGWNQIDATAIDQAGNASPYQHIWLVRQLAFYLPVIRK